MQTYQKNVQFKKKKKRRSKKIMCTVLTFFLVMVNVLY